MTKTQNREIDTLRLRSNLGRDHFNNWYTTLNQSIPNTRVETAVKLHQMSMPTREVCACRLNQLALWSARPQRGGLVTMVVYSLCSQERPVKQEPGHPAVTYPGGPWPVVYGVRAETLTQAFL